MTVLLTYILKIIKIDLSIIALVSIGENSTPNKFDGNSKVIWIKVDIRTIKSKSKNLVKPFLAKL